MTREEVLAMKPGEELDAVVAERVMGLKRGVDFGEWLEHKWKRNERGGIDIFGLEVGNHNGLACERCGYAYCCHCQSGPTEPCVAKPPPYSTDVKAAMAIIPAMAERGWDCATYYEAYVRRWTVYFLPRGCGSAKAESSSLAEAISKAALLAVLEEGEDA